MNLSSTSFNRIQGIHEIITETLAKAGPGQLEKLEKTLTLSCEEHFAYQEAKSLAQASGKLTLDEAMTVYTALGANHARTKTGWPRGTDLAMKVAITKLIADLLTGKWK